METKTLHFDWNWQLHASAEALWPYLSDTNRLFRDMKYPPVQKTDISYDLKDGYTQLSYNRVNSSDMWEEEPYQWEQPCRFGFRRCYRNGSYKEFRAQMDLFTNDRGTRVRIQLWATPGSLLGSIVIPLKIHLLVRPRLKSLLKDYDLLAQNRLRPIELEHPKKLVRGGARQMETSMDQLLNAIDEPEIAIRLADHLKRASDYELNRMEPYVLAEYWNLPRDRVLKVFLYAVKHGLLNFNWDLCCPECRTIQQRCKTLNEVHEPVLCKECSEEFHINFNHSIQLSFRAHPLIRKITAERHCLNGPQEYSHIAVQQLLKPGQQRYLKVKLEPGEYYMKIRGKKGRARLTVDPRGEENITIALTDIGLNSEQISVTEDPNLIFENRTGEDHIFILERAAWRSNTVTAARATSLQVFRDLFDKEILRKGEKIAVHELTLMFTDLLDSTGMYNKEGDSAAAGRVIEHFDVLQQAVSEAEGAIVKTIGDSIMAVFSTPAHAVRAFMKAQHIFTTDRQFNGAIKLKAGIHHGSCVAVNLNNRIDYFGSTVNIASRLVDLAGTNEVILSEAVCQNSETNQYLKRCGYPAKEITARLRGFDEEQFNIKRVSVEKSALRLVI